MTNNIQTPIFQFLINANWELKFWNFDLFVIRNLLFGASIDCAFRRLLTIFEHNSSKN